MQVFKLVAKKDEKDEIRVFSVRHLFDLGNLTFGFDGLYSAGSAASAVYVYAYICISVHKYCECRRFTCYDRIGYDMIWYLSLDSTFARVHGIVCLDLIFQGRRKTAVEVLRGFKSRRTAADSTS